MRAAWYERPGPAAEVLRVGEMAEPEPSPGEVRARIALSGVNPGDTQKRGDRLGAPARVRGVPGAAAAVAAQVGRCGGATLIGSSAPKSQLEQRAGAVADAVARAHTQPARAIRAHAPGGVHRISEVASSEICELEAAVAG